MISQLRLLHNWGILVLQEGVGKSQQGVVGTQQEEDIQLGVVGIQQEEEDIQQEKDSQREVGRDREEGHPLQNQLAVWKNKQLERDIVKNTLEH